MGYYNSISLAMKSDVAEKFRKEFPDPENLYSAAYGMEIEEKDGAVCARWPYEKRDPGEITDFLAGQPASSFLYSEEDELGENPEFGKWLDNPFFKARETVLFSSPREAFENLAAQLCRRAPKEEVMDAMKSAQAELEEKPAGKTAAKP